MLKSAFNSLLKIALSLVFWVFVLSIRWNGDRLFDALHDAMVDNEIVSAAEDGVEGVFDAIVFKVQSKYATMKKPPASSSSEEADNEEAASFN